MKCSVGVVPRQLSASWSLSAVLALLFVLCIPAPQAHAARKASHPHKLRPLKRHPVVALTFDDLPAAGGLFPGYTRVGMLTQLSDELKAAHITGAYGFVNAVDLPGDPDTEQALHIWVNSGMNIGNHTWSHPSLTAETATAYEANIARNEPYLRKYAGNRDWHYFRFPYLEEGDTLAKRDAIRTWLHDHGYRIAEVTLNFNDDDWGDPYGRCLAKHDEAGIAWLKQSYMQNAAEFIPLQRREEQMVFGHEIPNVLLLHGTAFTTLMLPQLIQMLKEQGFRFEPLPKVLRNAAYKKNPNVALPNGGSFPEMFMAEKHLKYPPFKPEPSQKLDNLCR
jgi:peptidoglycan/xylan/chitin deacetylase (PgdA/CDA1 family)